MSQDFFFLVWLMPVYIWLPTEHLYALHPFQTLYTHDTLWQVDNGNNWFGCLWYFCLEWLLPSLLSCMYSPIVKLYPVQVFSSPTSIFHFFPRHGFSEWQPWLYWNYLCRPGRLQTHFKILLPQPPEYWD